MAKPLAILVGGDKGGTGKTTVARALADYLQTRGANTKLFDGEYPAGDLRRFAKADVVDVSKLAGQRAVFDTIDGVTVLDIRAAQLSPTLRALDAAHLLDDVRAGNLNLALLHVLSPTDRSFGEIAEAARMIGAGARHFLIKNYAGDGGFEEWEDDARFSQQLRQMAAATITIPHLAAECRDAVEKLGISFQTFARNSSYSRILRGNIRTWLDEIFRDFDKAGLGELVAGAVE